MLDETIVAIATANGIGSVSIVRLSGNNALEIALKISKRDELKPRFATLSTLYNKNDEVIDEALLIYFKNPYSFTGEDIVEFQCHGGIAISNMIMQECLNNGSRLANPGEFSKRAFLNNKIERTQPLIKQSYIRRRSMQ